MDAARVGSRLVPLKPPAASGMPRGGNEVDALVCSVELKVRVTLILTLTLTITLTFTLTLILTLTLTLTLSRTAARWAARAVLARRR